LTALDVAIVSFKSRDLLRNCLTSLRRHPPSVPMHVVVVDNKSQDGTSEMVSHEFPEVTLVTTPENIGFARATNAAIRQGSAEYVLALNPDAEIRAETLDVLLRLMNDHHEVGICGCRLERPDGSFDHASRRSFPTILGALGHLLGPGRHRSRGKLAQYRAPEVERGPVDAVNGAFMLMRRSMLDEIGLFDEAYWMYMEDLDLCYRARTAGWVTWYEPEVSVMHVKGGTVPRQTSPRLTAAFYRSMRRFVRTHPAVVPQRGVRAAVVAGLYLFEGIAVGRARIRRIYAPPVNRVRRVEAVD
jgi:GT2 family glycosyltransferase